MSDPRYEQQGAINRIGTPRSPDFYCIGAEKCGTTWLWEMLRDHPEIGVPLPKELRYFASLYLGTGFGNFNALRRLLNDHGKAPLRRDFLEKLTTEIRVVFGDDQAYLRIFGAMKQTVVGDVSPQYCMLPSEGIARMKGLAPEAKIIFLMRDPVDRVVSAGKMKAGEQDSNLTDEAVRAKAFVPFQLRMSRYSKILDRYETHFPGQIFTGFMDDLIADPLDLLKRICGFLGVEYDARFFPRIDFVANEGAKYSVGSGMKAALYKELSEEYEFLSQRFPEQAAKWRARHEG